MKDDASRQRILVQNDVRRIRADRRDHAALLAFSRVHAPSLAYRAGPPKRVRGDAATFASKHDLDLPTGFAEETIRVVDGEKVRDHERTPGGRWRAPQKLAYRHGGAKNCVRVCASLKWRHADDHETYERLRWEAVQARFRDPTEQIRIEKFIISVESTWDNSRREFGRVAGLASGESRREARDQKLVRLQAILARGFDGTRKELALAVGVSLRTLYHYLRLIEALEARKVVVEPSAETAETPCATNVQVNYVPPTESIFTNPELLTHSINSVSESLELACVRPISHARARAGERENDTPIPCEGEKRKNPRMSYSARPVRPSGAVRLAREVRRDGGDYAELERRARSTPYPVLREAWNAIIRAELEARPRNG